MGRKQVLKRNYDSEGNLITKECSCCHKIKPVSEFNKNNSKADGLQLKCRECTKEHYKNNAEYYKEYNKNNAERIKERRKEYNKNNAERIKEQKKEYYKNNAERIREHFKEYYKNNAEHYKEYHKEYNKDNAERIKEQKKEYYKNNAEHYKEYHKEHYKNNAEYYKEYNKDNAERIKEYYKQYNTKQVQEALQQIKIEVESNPEKYNYIENKKIYGIIYLVHNINSDKYYVGQTTVGFDNRYSSGWLYEHGYKNSVKHDLELYGENSFEYIKLFKVAHSQYELDKLEAYYINYYNSFEKGYNENRGNIFTDRGKEK